MLRRAAEPTEQFIHRSHFERKPVVTSTPTPRSPDWIIQPLLDVGLERADISALVFRLAFECIVSESGTDPASLQRFVADRDVPVQTAWVQTITRLFAADLQ